MDGWALKKSGAHHAAGPLEPSWAVTEVSAFISSPLSSKKEGGLWAGKFESYEDAFIHFNQKPSTTTKGKCISLNFE